MMEAPLEPQHQQSHTPLGREDFRDYVAHLQLHMTLQARNLVPGFAQVADGRTQLLHQTQSTIERQVSRQHF